MAALSTTNGPGEASIADNSWNESKILSSLDQLQNMHIQLRHLRETMPQLLDPLLVQHASPEQLYSSYSHNALETAKAIKSFVKFVQEPRAQETLRRAKESRAAGAEDITPWIVTEHADWLDVRDKPTEAGSSAQEGDMPNGETAAFPTAEEVAPAVERFRSKHAGLEINQRIGNSTFIQIHLPPPAAIHFVLALNPQRASFEVTCKEKSKIHEAILEAVNSQLRSNSLDHVLGMLASYSDIKSRPCAKCERLLDRDARFPTVRSDRGPNSANGVWQAFHPSCP